MLPSTSAWVWLAAMCGPDQDFDNHPSSGSSVIRARISALARKTAEQAKKEVLASAAMVTVVDDREGDIYPKWATEHAREGSVPQDNFHLLTRAMVDRRLANPEAGGVTRFGVEAVHRRIGDQPDNQEMPQRPADHAEISAKLRPRQVVTPVVRPRDTGVAAGHRARWVSRLACGERQPGRRRKPAVRQPGAPNRRR